MAFKIFYGHNGAFVGETGFGEVVAELSREAEAHINSHARDQKAASLLHSLSPPQHTQAEVIRFHNEGVPGYGPANPVNGTTHCRRNDGRAYRWWPWGFRIPKWARGIDVEPGRRNQFCDAGRRRGYVISATYPGSVGEAQHVNFRKAPIIKPRVVKRGDRGKLVKHYTKMLVYVTDEHGHHYLKNTHSIFDGDVDNAVKAFQKDHRAACGVPDGVIGLHTAKSLSRVYKREKASHRKRKREEKHG